MMRHAAPGAGHRPRVPVVAGVGGGVGTTTVAAALHARDAGVCAGTAVDVLVCRATGESLRRAAALVRALPGRAPVLAVTADLAVPGRGPVAARLRMVAADVAAVVVLPPVRRWRALADPVVEAATLLGCAPGGMPRPLRAYAAALRDLARAVAEDGRLADGAAPPRPEPRPGPPPPRLARADRAVPLDPVGRPALADRAPHPDPLTRLAPADRAPHPGPVADAAPLPARRAGGGGLRVLAVAGAPAAAAVAPAPVEPDRTAGLVAAPPPVGPARPVPVRIAAPRPVGVLDRAPVPRERAVPVGAGGVLPARVRAER